MELNIHSFVGAEPLRFGMSKQDVINILGAPDQEFIRNPSVGYRELAYEEIGIYVSLNHNSECNAVMIFRPASARFAGKDLLEISGSDAIETLKKVDPAYIFENGSLTSNAFGISLYVPDLTDEPDEPAKSVLVFARGYFDY